MKKTFLLTLAAMFMFVAGTFAQSMEGVWKTVDDELNIAKSHVKIYTKNGKYYGFVQQILRADHVNDKCTNCTDYRKDQPILNMEIVSGLSLSGGVLSGGTILDPEKGKIYRCKMWLDESGNLKVRGYLGPLYRTQTWYRVQ